MSTKLPQTKFYLAGKWADRQALLVRANELEQLSWQCTYKWMLHENIDPELQGQAREQAMAHMAVNDLNGVLAADVVVALMDDPKYPYRGTCTELGAALAAKKTVVVINPHGSEAYCYNNVFYHHPDIIHYQSWAEAKSELRKAIFVI